jgi:hypothetical protein
MGSVTFVSVSTRRDIVVVVSTAGASIRKSSGIVCYTDWVCEYYPRRTHYPSSVVARVRSLVVARFLWCPSRSGRLAVMTTRSSGGVARCYTIIDCRLTAVS